MALFDFLKKKDPAPAAYEVKEYPFVLAKHFKGFKKMAMEVHFDPECRDNNLLFKDVDVTGWTATFKDVAPDLIELWLDGKKIGNIREDKNILAIREGQISDIYLKFEEDEVIRLKEKTEREIRPRFHLLVKYKE